MAYAALYPAPPEPPAAGVVARPTAVKPPVEESKAEPAADPAAATPATPAAPATPGTLVASADDKPKPSAKAHKAHRKDDAPLPPWLQPKHHGH
jgi:hypothetical protein